MTDHDETTPDRTEVHALSGAYAVDALDDLERARFEEHLSRCADCQAEVDSLREAAATLAHEPVDPPASLRASVLAGIEEVRPLPPLTEETPERLDVVGGDGERRRWSWRSAPLLVAAALVVVALAVTTWVRPWADDDGPLSPTDQVLQADDAKSYVQELPDGSRAEVVVSRSEGRAVIVTDDMAPAPEGKVYELWLQPSGGDMVPAGLMPDDTDATVLLDGDVTDATAVGITVEPDGGSPEPTAAPILLFDLTA